LEGACEQGLVFRVVTESDELEDYLQLVEKVAGDSWQGRRLGNPTTVAKLLEPSQQLAEHQLFRGYLLSNGDEAIAYVFGRVADWVFLPEKAGFTSSLSKFSPGKHLWYRVLEDLFSVGTVNWLDFGMYDLWYKEFWANESYKEDSILLLRPSVRTLLALGPSIAFRLALRAVSRLLAQFGLQSRFRRFLYRLSRGPVSPSRPED